MGGARLTARQRGEVSCSGLLSRSRWIAPSFRVRPQCREAHLKCHSQRRRLRTNKKPMPDSTTSARQSAGRPCWSSAPRQRDVRHPNPKEEAKLPLRTEDTISEGENPRDCTRAHAHTHTRTQKTTTVGTNKRGRQNRRRVRNQLAEVCQASAHEQCLVRKGR